MHAEAGHNLGVNGWHHGNVDPKHRLVAVNPLQVWEADMCGELTVARWGFLCSNWEIEFTHLNLTIFKHGNPLQTAQWHAWNFEFWCQSAYMSCQRVSETFSWKSLIINTICMHLQYSQGRLAPGYWYVCHLDGVYNWSDKTETVDGVFPSVWLVAQSWLLRRILAA